MPATIDTANLAPFSAGTGTSQSFNCTCAPGDNFLVVLEANYSTAPQAPTAVKYNGVAMTLLQSASSTASFGNGMECSIWYLANPPTGVADVVLETTGSNVGTTALLAVPMAGVNLGAPFATPASANSQANNNAALNVATAPTNGLFLAVALNGIQTMVAAGANQTNVHAFNGLGGAQNVSVTADTIPGVNAGAFSWTASGTVWQGSWQALGVGINGSLSGAATAATSASGTQGVRHIVADMTVETTTTTGTSPFALGGAVSGYRTFGSVMSDQDTCLYVAQAISAGAPSGPWEIGIGTYNLSTNSLTRTQVMKSSNANAPVPFPAGTSYVSLTEPGEVLWNKGVHNVGLSGSAITIDWSNGPYQMVTLNAANPVISFANSMLCPHGVLEIYQDVTGGRVPTISGAVYRSGSPPTWSTTAATHDTLQIRYNVVTRQSNVSLMT